MRVTRVLVIVVLVIVALAACGGGGTAGECSDGETRPCYGGPPNTEGVGACEPGIETCSGGRWPGVCLGDRTPFVETCNGVDDDCDGAVDNAAGTGADCVAGGCAGSTVCKDGAVACVAPPKNECGVCDGRPVSGLGDACIANGCPGALACSGDGEGTVCSAPVENECGVCGGPAVTGLGVICMGPGNCAGRMSCNAAGTAAVCDCSEGLCNDGGTLRPIRFPQQGEVVITEVMPNPDKVADSDGEWFEVKTLVDLDLNGIGVTKTGGSTSTITGFDCVPVPAGSHLVFARKSDPLVNGGLPAVTATFTFDLNNTTGDLRVVRGTTLIDEITWTSSRAGKALQLDPAATTATANDDPAYFCDATSAYGDGDLGTPGAANGACPVVVPGGQCLDGGTPRAIVTPSAGQLVISEIHPRPSVSQTTREWIEIYNAGTTAFDLNGLGVDREGDTLKPSLVQATDCKSVPPGGHALFARSGDPGLNGMLPAVDATFGFAMVDTNGNARVLDCTAAGACDTATPTAPVLDAVSWATSTSGASSQLDASKLVVGSAFPGDWCTSTSTYGDGLDKGTPRAANILCPVAAPNTCVENGASRVIVPPAAGQLVITELMPRPAVGDGGAGEWFEITNVGTTAFDLNGLGLDREADTRKPDVITSSLCKPVAPGGFALFARGTDPATNGGLPAVDATFGFGLLNTNGNVRVVDPTSCDIDSPFQCTVVFDVVAYTTTTVWPMFGTAGVSAQVKPGMYTTTANDLVANFCAGQTDYGAGGKGTPGADNDCP